jgi:hypothetical protein
MCKVKYFDGEIGTASICRVRTADNPLGERWHVRAEYSDGGSWVAYEGPDPGRAADAWEEAKDQVR